MFPVELLLVIPSLDTDAWSPWLDEGERARAARFRQSADRSSYIAAHGLLRLALSARDPAVAPREWSFGVGAHGKPVLENGPLKFNLSHCRELVAVAITEGAEVGVDVEPVDPRHATDAVARRVYGPTELADLAAQGVERFFERWTVKESWVKATGIGLSDDLPSVEIPLVGTREGRAALDGWQFQWWTPLPTVKLAVCVGTDRPLDATPRFWR